MTLETVLHLPCIFQNEGLVQQQILMQVVGGIRDWFGRQVCLGQGHVHLDRMGLNSSSCRVRFALGMS